MGSKKKYFKIFLLRNAFLITVVCPRNQLDPKIDIFKKYCSGGGSIITAELNRMPEHCRAEEKIQ